MKHVERKAWAKVNYSRPECLEVPGIRETLNKKAFKRQLEMYLKGIVLIQILLMSQIFTV